MKYNSSVLFICKGRLKVKNMSSTVNDKECFEYHGGGLCVFGKRIVIQCDTQVHSWDRRCGINTRMMKVGKLAVSKINDCSVTYTKESSILSSIFLSACGTSTQAKSLSTDVLLIF